MCPRGREYRILHPIFCPSIAEEQKADIMLVLWAGLMWWFRRLAERLALARRGKKWEQIRFAFDSFDALVL